MASLAEIRAKLKKKEAAAKASSGDNASYPFWNTPVGQTSTIRFLPDGDTSNEFFWRERLVIKIPFVGIKGGDEHKQVDVQVPCVQMWGDTCPITEAIRDWWSDKRELARLYYRKKSYVTQGFVVASGFDEEQTPTNPIRRFVINESLFKIVYNTLMDADIEDFVIDYDKGRDFRINVQKQGDYKSYNASAFAMRTRSLSPVERQALDTHGLHNLSDALPARPTADQLAAIEDMFRASVDGELYDPSRFAEYYRPYGVQKPSNSNSPTASAAVAIDPEVARYSISTGLTTAEILAKVGRNAING